MNVLVGKGLLQGKGVYAARDFAKGEVVIEYNLKKLSVSQLQALPESEREFVHNHWGELYLYAEPERYVNHSDNPNTVQDLKKGCDIALHDILKGQAITTNAKLDDALG